MNGKYILLWISYMSCIMIQQMARDVGKYNDNQMLTDYGNLETLAIDRNKEITELTLGNIGNKHQYNRDQLYELMLKVENDNRYKSLEPKTCITVRQLRLNKQGCEKRGGTRKEVRHNHRTTRGINIANLVQVHTKPIVDQDQGRNRQNNFIYCWVTFSQLRIKNFCYLNI